MIHSVNRGVKGVKIQNANDIDHRRNCMVVSHSTQLSLCSLRTYITRMSSLCVCMCMCDATIVNIWTAQANHTHAGYWIPKPLLTFF